MTHTTASSVGGFLSSLPPPNRAGKRNAFISDWFIAALPSTARRESCLGLTSTARWSLSSLCKELAGGRMLGVRRNRKAHSSPNFLGGFQKTKPSLYFLSLLWNNQTTQRALQWNWTLAKPQSLSQWGMVRTGFWGRKKRPPEQNHLL